MFGINADCSRWPGVRGWRGVRMGRPRTKGRPRRKITSLIYPVYRWYNCLLTDPQNIPSGTCNLGICRSARASGTTSRCSWRSPPRAPPSRRPASSSLSPLHLGGYVSQFGSQTPGFLGILSKHTRTGSHPCFTSIYWLCCACFCSFSKQRVPSMSTYQEPQAFLGDCFAGLDVLPKKAFVSSFVGAT